MKSLHDRIASVSEQVQASLALAAKQNEPASSENQRSSTCPKSELRVLSSWAKGGG